MHEGGGRWVGSNKLVELKTKQNKKKNLQPVNAGEGVEKREPFCTVGRNVNW